MGIQELTEEDWRDILNSINSGNCILVIGPDIICDEKGESLKDKLRQEVKKRLDLDNTFPGDIHELVELLLDKDKLDKLNHKNVRVGEAVNRIVDDFYKNKPGYELLLKLSQIPFRLYLSTSPDLTLEEIFRKHTLNHTFSYYGYKGGAAVEVKNIDSANPWIYNLCGKYTDNQTTIFNYDSLYKYLFSVLSLKNIPQLLMEECQNSNHGIILLGYDFDSWYHKMFLKMLNVEQKTFSFYTRWKEYKEDQGRFYSNRFGMLNIPENPESVKKFVDELVRRCQLNDDIKRQMRSLDHDGNNKIEMDSIIEEIKSNSDLSPVFQKITGIVGRGELRLPLIQIERAYKLHRMSMINGTTPDENMEDIVQRLLLLCDEVQ